MDGEKEGQGRQKRVEEGKRRCFWRSWELEAREQAAEGKTNLERCYCTALEKHK